MRNKYKILYIDDWGGWGGAEKIVFTLVKSLDRERYEPYFILGSDGPFAQILRAERISVQIVPMKPMSVPASKRPILPLLMLLFLGRLAWYTWRTYIIARRLRPDLIQTCSIQAKLIGSLTAKMIRTKLLWHVQTMQPPGFRRQLVHSMAKHFPDLIVATSQAVAGIYTGIIPCQKLQVNCAGIDATSLTDIDRSMARKSLRMELGLTEQNIVVFASMIRPGKGVHVFIQAAGEILKHFSDVAFLVVGEAQFDKDYEYKDQVLNLVRQLGVTKKVKFLGFRVDVGDILAAADCLVHCPTEDDALPTVVLEAMALQTPVVGSIIGGIPEQIEDNVTGFLIEPGDSKGVANAVMQILEIPEKALCLGRSGRQKFEKEFSHQQFVQKFETIYTGLLP